MSAVTPSVNGSSDKEDIAIGIFRKVAETDDSICNTDAYRSREKRVQD